jgi:hypothetical protein
MVRIVLTLIIHSLQAASETSASYCTKIVEVIKIEAKEKQSCHFYVVQTGQTREMFVFFQAVLLRTSEE